jgi:uncharacterized membrane protein YkoI
MLISLAWLNGPDAQPLLNPVEPGGNLVPQTRQAMISSETAALRAQARYGGRVLSVQLERPAAGAPFYRVKLLSNGNVRVVHVGAEE